MIILASTSSARAALLRQAGVDFVVQASELDEAPLKARWLADGVGPLEIAGRLAAAKAEAILADVPAGSWVVGGDQTAEFEGELLDKAPSTEVALERLRKMRGRSHRLHSAAVLTNGLRTWRTTSTSTLHVREFSDAWLVDYARSVGPALTATVGGYELEGLGAQLFERVEGDFFAILGLPLIELLAELRRQGLAPT